VTNLVTNIVTKVIIVLVIGVMVTIVTIDLLVIMVTDVPGILKGTQQSGKWICFCPQVPTELGLLTVSRLSYCLESIPEMLGSYSNQSS
jgi:hypothetical protein